MKAKDPYREEEVTRWTTIGEKKRSTGRKRKGQGQ